MELAKTWIECMIINVLNWFKCELNIYIYIQSGFRILEHGYTYLKEWMVLKIGRW